MPNLKKTFQESQHYEDIRLSTEFDENLCEC